MIGTNSANGTSPAPQLSTPYHTSGQHANSSIHLGAPYAANQALGYYGSASTGTDRGTLLVKFAQPISEVVVEYSNKLGSPYPNPAAQQIAIANFEFCTDPAPVANIQTSESQFLHSSHPNGCNNILGTPDPQATFIGPGACIEYRINASNTGNALADKLSIINVLSDNMIFQGATHVGFDSGGAGFGLSAPSLGQDCGGGACAVALENASLPAGNAGEIIIRALVK